MSRSAQHRACPYEQVLNEPRLTPRSRQKSSRGDAEALVESPSGAKNEAAGHELSPRDYGPGWQHGSCRLVWGEHCV